MMSKMRLWMVVLLTLMVCFADRRAIAKESIIASGTCGEAAIWVLDDEGRMAISGKGEIMDYLSECDVPWYEYREQIKELSVEAGITRVGNRAFALCKTMERVSLPDGLTEIGFQTFIGCCRIKKLNIPSCLSIGEGAFESCVGLTEIILPKGLEKIGGYAFQCCSALVDIDIPDSVKYIGDGAFNLCTSLNGMAIPDGVKSIGDDTFSQCKKLKWIEIPSSVQSIGYAAFYQCGNLQRMVIPEGVLSIGEYAFSQCGSLMLVSIPDSLVSIGDFAFYENNGKEGERIVVHSGEDIPEVGWAAFGFWRPTVWCESSVETDWAALGYSTSCWEDMWCDLILPEATVLVEEGAFAGLTQVERIAVPAGCAEIEGRAFAECRDLVFVRFMGENTEIAEDAFDGCEALVFFCPADSKAAVYARKRGFAVIAE